MNPTRLSKISRLPRPVREELNERLDNGEMGQQLVDWLNAQPEVQAVLAAHFDGRAITEQNLSVWKQGGFADWLRHLEAREWVGRVLEESQDLEATGSTRLADHVAVQVLMELVKLLRKAVASEDEATQRKAVLDVAKQLNQLRRSDHQAERTQMEKERLELTKQEARKVQEGNEIWAAGVEQIKADFHPFYPDGKENHLSGGTGGLAPDIANCLAINARLRKEAGLPLNFSETLCRQFENAAQHAAAESPYHDRESNLIQPFREERVPDPPRNNAHVPPAHLADKRQSPAMAENPQFSILDCVIFDYLRPQRHNTRRTARGFASEFSSNASRGKTLGRRGGNHAITQSRIENPAPHFCPAPSRSHSTVVLSFLWAKWHYLGTGHAL